LNLVVAKPKWIAPSFVPDFEPPSRRAAARVRITSCGSRPDRPAPALGTPRDAPRMSAPATEAMTPERLHARYAVTIRRQVRRMITSESDREDVVQEVLIAIMLGFHAVREPKSADAWVRRVTTIKVFDLIRQRRLQPDLSLEALPEVPSSASHPQSARDLASRAVRLLERLPPKESSLLMAYWFTPVTAETLADQNGCSVVTLRRRLLRARMRFERLARRDAELVACIGEARLRSRRWRHTVHE
jgi:RNA polymerase sigma-70 factor, ECF subfamily